MRGVVGGAFLGLCVVGLAFGGRVPVFRAVSGLLHATALPVFTIALCAVTAGGALLLALRSPERRPGTYVFAAIAGCTGLALICLQGVAGTGRTAEAADPRAGTRIRVVDANVLRTNTDYGPVLDRAAAADVVALAEADYGTVVEGLAVRGLADDFKVYASTPVMPHDTVLLVRTRLAPAQIPAARLPFAAVGAQTNVGRFVAVHTASPSARSPLQSTWQTTVRDAAAQCGTDTIVAGDFNATWPQLRGFTGCGDAARALHMGAAGSWRSSWPSWLGAQIDHQLYDTGAFAPVSSTLFDINGSDHRGLDTEYMRTGGVGQSAK